MDGGAGAAAHARAPSPARRRPGVRWHRRLRWRRAPRARDPSLAAARAHPQVAERLLQQRLPSRVGADRRSRRRREHGAGPGAAARSQRGRHHQRGGGGRHQPPEPAGGGGAAACARPRARALSSRAARRPARLGRRPRHAGAALPGSARDGGRQDRHVRRRRGLRARRRRPDPALGRRHLRHPEQLGARAGGAPPPGRLRARAARRRRRDPVALSRAEGRAVHGGRLE